MDSIEEGEAEKMTVFEEEEEEIATELAQQKLADLASSLMAAAASNAQGGEGGEEQNSNSEAETITKPLVKKARKLLFRRLRVGVEDSRVFIGKFHCLDKQGNIILYDTVEYRQISPPSSPPPSSKGSDGKSSSGFASGFTTEEGRTEQRSLGLVLIPARCRTSCHVECSLQEQFSLLSV